MQHNKQFGIVNNNLIWIMQLSVVFSMIIAFAAEAQKGKPNILFIMSDDHSRKAISAYGYGLNKTPNIDRIANEGSRFTHMYATNSLCAPARAVILTGKYSHLNGHVNNKTTFNGDQVTFPKLLQKEGYQTAVVGKWHLVSQPQGFDYYNVVPSFGDYYNPDFIEQGEKKVYQGYLTSITTEIALKWLEKRDEQRPFLMMLQYSAPHRNWLPEEKYLSLYEDREFPFPENFFDDYEGRGSAAHEQKMQIVRDMRWGVDMKFEKNPYTGEETTFARSHIKRMNEQQLKAWRDAYGPRNDAFTSNIPEGVELAKWKYHRYIRDYLKCVQSIDDGVGQVLDYLKENGLEENTIVIYTSDQGMYLGENGWFDKRFMYEESTLTPFLIRWPGNIPAKSIVNDMVLNLDLAPTFLDFAGIDIPKDMQGESFMKLTTGAKLKNWRTKMYYHFYEYPGAHFVKRQYGIRTQRYKLIHYYYDVDEWELFDLDKDPEELTSVYNDPTYKEIKLQLHKQLNEIRAEYGDSDELTRSFLPELKE